MPPITGPTTEASPQAPVKTLWMVARSSSVYRSELMVRVVGCTAPAPSPCRTRKATSIGTEVEKPHSTEPRRKSAIPARKVAFRPIRSASRPLRSTPTVEARRKPVKTQA